MKKLAIISLSGGMDSTSLLIHLLANDYQVKIFNFDYGSRQNKIELEKIIINLNYLALRGLRDKFEFKNLDLKQIFNDSNSALFHKNNVAIPEEHYTAENQKVTVVENRNAIFSNILFGKALSWANKENNKVIIALGIHSGDHAIYPDCKPEFRDAMEKAMKLGNDNSERINYYTPYLEGNKKSILEDLIFNCNKLALNPYTILSNTNTCYNPDENGIACGKCGSCVERLEAFELLDMKDPILYKES